MQHKSVHILVTSKWEVNHSKYAKYLFLLFLQLENISILCQFYVYQTTLIFFMYSFNQGKYKNLKREHVFAGG